MSTSSLLQFGLKPQCVATFIAGEEAPAAVEYGILLGLISVMLAGAATVIGGQIAETFSYFALVLRL